MSTTDIIAGLQILVQYDKTKYSMDAEHDVVYCGPESPPLTDEHRAELLRLGWLYSDEVDRWMHFT